MRWSVGLVGLALAGPLAGQQVEVSLDEAIRRALDAQPAMVSARGNAVNAGAARRTALGAFLPSVTVTGGASLNSRPRIDPNNPQIQIPPIWNYSSNLAASVDLFTGFRRMWNLRSSSATVDAREAGVVTQRFTTTLETKRVFYNAIATEELVRVAAAQVRRAEQQLQISIEKLHAGSATRSDSLRSTVDYGNARIALLQAQANLATAQATLGRQIGVDQPVRAVPDSAMPPLPDTAALRATAIEAAPQVEQAEAEARAARASVWSARTQYIPRLFLSYGNNRQDTLLTHAFVNNAYHTWSIGLQWNLFNGFAREQQQVAAGVTRDLAEATAADARRGVNASLTQQIAALGTAHEQIAIARDNVAAGTEDLRVQQERYRVGAATILDLLTSQASLTQAEVNLVQARFNYLIARAQLEALVGKAL